MKLTEKREQARFSLRLSARLEADGRDCQPRLATGTTRDISCAGAYLHLDDPFPVGTRTRVLVFLRPPVGGAVAAAAGSRIEVMGTVLRHEAGGMAVRFEREFTLVPQGEAG